MISQQWFITFLCFSVACASLDSNGGLTIWKSKDFGHYYREARVPGSFQVIGNAVAVLDVSGHIDSYLDIEIAQEMMKSKRSYIQKMNPLKIINFLSYYTKACTDEYANEYKKDWNKLSNQEKLEFIQDMFNAAKSLKSGVDFKGKMVTFSSNQRSIIRSHVVSNGRDQFQLSFASESKVFSYESVVGQALGDTMWIKMEKIVIDQTITTNNGKNFECKFLSNQPTCVEIKNGQRDINSVVALPAMKGPSFDAKDDGDKLAELFQSAPPKKKNDSPKPPIKSPEPPSSTKKNDSPKPPVDSPEPPSSTKKDGSRKPPINSPEPPSSTKRNDSPKPPVDSPEPPSSTKKDDSHDDLSSTSAGSRLSPWSLFF